MGIVTRNVIGFYEPVKIESKVHCSVAYLL